MTVAIYVNDENDVATLVPWGYQIATSMRNNLLIVVPRRTKKEDVVWNELTRETIKAESPLHNAILDSFEALDCEKFAVGSENQQNGEEFDPQKICVTAKELCAPDPNASLVTQVEQLDISVLIIDSDEPQRQMKDNADEDPLDLFFDTQCETMVLRGKPPKIEKPLSILVVAEKLGIDSEVAIRRAHTLAKPSDGTVTFLYIRPDDDEVADQAGLMTANRLVNQAFNIRHEIGCRVTLAEKMSDGIAAQPDLDQFDLVVITAQSSTAGYKFVKAWEGSETTNPIPLAIIRSAVPLTKRIWNKFTNSVRSLVPQIDRETRVKLVERLNTSSKWDIDFIALISLSTLIAALGLIRNSGAVVIGAMLIAPLMTPLVGIGFAMAQSNLRLIRQSLRSLVFGFALAFVIGVLVGTFVTVTGFHTTAGLPTISELQARNNPNFLDLIVALVSGIAGAYAWGRPNLFSALPGVAIAAALVPPIATSGIALSCFSLDLFLGALLLFFTNIVAIILGCTIVFWAVGIDSLTNKKNKSGDARPAHQWPRYVLLVFVVLSIVLAAVMHYMDPKSYQNQEDATSQSTSKVSK